MSRAYIRRLNLAIIIGAVPVFSKSTYLDKKSVLNQKNNHSIIPLTLTSQVVLLMGAGQYKRREHDNSRANEKTQKYSKV
jgi:hypothetical protein